MLYCRWFATRTLALRSFRQRGALGNSQIPRTCETSLSAMWPKCTASPLGLMYIMSSHGIAIHWKTNDWKSIYSSNETPKCSHAGLVWVGYGCVLDRKTMQHRLPAGTAHIRFFVCNIEHKVYVMYIDSDESRIQTFLQRANRRWQSNNLHLVHKSQNYIGTMHK